MKISKRGRIFTGVVISDKMSKTVTVEWTRRHYLPKYERYEIRRTRVKAHNPPEIDARAGDTVRIQETRPLSKTKHFIVIEKITPTAPKEQSTTEQKEKKTTKKKTTKKGTTS